MTIFNNFSRQEKFLADFFTSWASVAYDELKRMKEEEN